MAGGHAMVARRATDAARRALQSTQAKAAHQASLAVLPRVEKKKIPKPEHGRRIYVFNHIQTNQVVYSLKAAMENNPSLKQLPYNGKKTIPSALRKDHWHPLCQVIFPAAGPAPAPVALTPSKHRRQTSPPPSNINPLGLSAFQKLREYRKLHELEWDTETMSKDPETGYNINKKLRGRKLCDQKANTIADLAAVLGEVTTDEKSGEIIVKWSDLLDAEYAETWSSNVVHDLLEYKKNNRDPMGWSRSRAQEVEEPASDEVVA